MRRYGFMLSVSGRAVVAAARPVYALPRVLFLGRLAEAPKNALFPVGYAADMFDRYDRLCIEVDGEPVVFDMDWEAAAPTGDGSITVPLHRKPSVVVVG